MSGAASNEGSRVRGRYAHLGRPRVPNPVAPLVDRGVEGVGERVDDDVGGADGDQGTVAALVWRRTVSNRARHRGGARWSYKVATREGRN